jgi:hypothetical protein
MIQLRIYNLNMILLNHIRYRSHYLHKGNMKYKYKIYEWMKLIIHFYSLV